MSAATDGGWACNPNEVKKFTAEEAIPLPGLFIKPGTAAEKVKLCTAGVRPIGISYRSTINPYTHVAEANVPVAVFPLAEGARFWVHLVDANAEIAFWDQLIVQAGGKVDKLDTTGTVVARALDTAEASSGDVILAVLEYEVVA